MRPPLFDVWSETGYLIYGQRPGLAPAGDLLSSALESRQRALSDCLCPCASLRANLRHTIQPTVPPNSLRGMPLRSDKRRQASSQSNAVLRQHCPQPEPRAAGTVRRVGADSLQDLWRNQAQALIWIAVAAIKFIAELSCLWYCPLCPRLRRQPLVARGCTVECRRIVITFTAMCLNEERSSK